MKLNIHQSFEYEETEITIHCNTINPELQKIIDQIRLLSFSIKGRIDQTIYQIALENILYFDCVDNKTFIYCEDKTLETDEKLYELEDKLKNTSFVRISKSCIVNTSKVVCINPIASEKYEIQLVNNEKVIISRHYMPYFKKKIGL
ncbi:LytTR family DNA-binding domain-containing protein [Anaeromicropila herbilytica]|uniref:Transcriptional regulator n=1 Tax=Anaeromicropila herbilytica TaxID=2785025 RepID=A0A7R7EL76_9FIRM|nr:LytTR family DNA-binding domain-containing protein [Anaeromicropila herbilytica]BCN30635.1 transcriptional regulator [Anaeromicropila herbilytica]